METRFRSRKLIRLSKFFTSAVILSICVSSLVHMMTHDVGIRDPVLSKTVRLTEDLDLVLPDLEDPNNIEQMSQQIQRKSPCPHLGRPLHIKHNQYGGWQRTQDQDKEVLVYSAFYDDRPAVDMVPMLRILAVSTTNKDLYCQIWYDRISNPYVTKVKSDNSGRGDKHKGVFYGQYLFSCELPGAHPVPSRVSIATSECGSSTIYLPVVVPVRSPWKVEFGLCVAVAFGNLNVDQFVEWMELNKILGVQEFHVYNATINATFVPIFKSYSDDGSLFVHNIPPPKDDWTKMGAKLGSPASLNDCMLRNMYRYRYIVVVDFDEFIVPRTSRNYHQMLDNILKEHKLKTHKSVYTFRNTYYFLDFVPDESRPTHLTAARFLQRIEPSGHLFAPKSFVDPRQCLSLFNHYCYINFPGYDKHFDVNASIARSHHYKRCNFGKVKCTEMSRNHTYDDVVSKYQEELVKNVAAKRQLLKLPKS